MKTIVTVKIIVKIVNVYFLNLQTLPGFSHTVYIGGPNHKNSNISQGHQQVFTGARLTIGTSPVRLTSNTRVTIKHSNAL